MDETQKEEDIIIDLGPGKEPRYATGKVFLTRFNNPDCFVAGIDPNYSNNTARVSYHMPEVTGSFSHSHWDSVLLSRDDVRILLDVVRDSDQYGRARTNLIRVRMAFDERDRVRSDLAKK